MRIVITHLTRMEQGYICVAGVEPRSGVHVRPILGDRLHDRLLLRHAGPFDIAALVDLGPTARAGSPPALEDQRFNLRNTRRLQDLSPESFWELLERVARPSLLDIFGTVLQPRHRTYTVKLGAGKASLGCLVPASVGFEADRALGKLRLLLTDAAGPVSLSLTDLRFYQPDHKTPRWEVVQAIDAPQEGRPGHSLRRTHPPLPAPRRSCLPPLAAGQQSSPTGPAHLAGTLLLICAIGAPGQEGAIAVATRCPGC